MVLNPAVIQIVGQDGLAHLLRQVFDGLHIYDVVPTEQEMATMERMSGFQQQIQAQQQQALPHGREVDGGGAVQGGEQGVF